MSAIPIPNYLDRDQTVIASGKEWRVAGLIHHAKRLQVFDLPLRHISLRWDVTVETLKELAWHVKAVNAANLDSPIILGDDGELLDGRHRVAKALLDGAETIKAVRFEKNPPADWRHE
jgi:hypothetical protein